MPRGVPRTGRPVGRPKGSKTKKTVEFRESLRQYAKSKNVDPFFWMADLVANEDAKLEYRLQAAKELAQYLEPKLKSIEVTGNADKPLFFQTVDQRQARIADLLAKLPPEQAAVFQARLNGRPTLEVVDPPTAAPIPSPTPE